MKRKKEENGNGKKDEKEIEKKDEKRGGCQDFGAIRLWSDKVAI